MSGFAEETIFARTPKHPNSVYSVVGADHMGLATMISPGLIAWLKSLGY